MHFIRTTDAHHEKAAQEFWKICNDRGYIYKKNYQVKYCVGCELEKTDSELVDGKCPIHPTKEIELIDEENYFFKFSELQKLLLDHYEKNPDFVIPDFRFNEIKAFVSRGLEDFSISRLASKMPWGIPVPGDESQVMYVWFDALVNYISTLGWPENKENFNHFWAEGSPVQYCGQDNLRQQSAMWQAMLLAAGLPLSRHIIINGFIMGEGGIKMSKSIGNVIDPIPLVAEYGIDALRYYLLRHIHPHDGSPMTLESFKERYNGDLANGIGNLASRLLTLSEKYLEGPVDAQKLHISAEWHTHMERFRQDLALDLAWKEVGELDKAIADTRPFEIAKTDLPRAQELLREYLERLGLIARMIAPLLPETSEKIILGIASNKKPEKPLFLRK